MPNANSPHCKKKQADNNHQPAGLSTAVNEFGSERISRSLLRGKQAFIEL